MATFTREQRARLVDAFDLVASQIEILVSLLQRSNARFVALHNLLGARGLITPREWESALAEVEAAVAVEAALGPDLGRLREAVRELLDDERGRPRRG